VEGDAERWDERYRDAEEVAPAPPEAIAAIDPALVPSSGRMLDLACGLGRQAVWGAERGLQVTAVDVSSVAVERTGRLAAAHGVDVDVRAADLDRLLGAPDPVTELDGPYELVVCQRYRDPRLLRLLADLLAPGGMAVVTVLSVVGAAAPGPFHAPAGELADAVAVDGRLEVIHATEGRGEASVVVRRRQGTETVA
jgi:SAM-dependent methyltransferase